MRPLPTWGADAHLAWSTYSVVSLNCRDGSPGLIEIGRRMHAICPERKLEPDTKPTVSLDVISLVVVRKNAVTSLPSQDETHRAARLHDGARPEPCCALMDASSMGQDLLGEAGTAPALGVSQR